MAMMLVRRLATGFGAGLIQQRVVRGGYVGYWAKGGEKGGFVVVKRVDGVLENLQRRGMATRRSHFEGLRGVANGRSGTGDGIDT